MLAVGGLPLEVKRSKKEKEKKYSRILKILEYFSENTYSFKSRCLVFAKFHFPSNCHLVEFVQLGKKSLSLKAFLGDSSRMH